MNPIKILKRVCSNSALKRSISLLENDIKLLRNRVYNLELSSLLNLSVWQLMLQTNEPEQGKNWWTLTYKGEDVLSIFINGSVLRIRKVYKFESLKADNIFMSDVYLMLFKQLKATKLESDIYVSEEAKKMWMRIKQSTPPSIYVQTDTLPYYIEWKVQNSNSC